MNISEIKPLDRTSPTFKEDLDDFFMNGFPKLANEVHVLAELGRLAEFPDPPWRLLAQTVEYKTGALASGTTTIPADNTAPQNTEGDQYLSVAITPQNASSILEITVNLTCSLSAATNAIAALFQDSLPSALATGWVPIPATSLGNISFVHEMQAGGVAPMVFKVRAGPQSACTLYLNGVNGNPFFGGTLATRIAVKEYLP